MGLRSDYNGVLLLDTILQPPLTNTDHPVKIELLLSEAVLLHQSLVLLEQQGVENSADVINELVQRIGEAVVVAAGHARGVGEPQIPRAHRPDVAAIRTLPVVQGGR